MERTDTDDETLNREAAYGEDGRVRDDRNLIEKARDAVASPPNRTHADVDTVHRTTAADIDATRRDVEWDAEGRDAMNMDAVRLEAVDDNKTGIAEPPAGPAQGVSPALSAPAASVESSVAQRYEADLAAGAPSVLTKTSAQESAPNLLPTESLDRFQSRWQKIQIGFVDDPRTAVRDAESLVNDMVSELTAAFTRERQMLEQHWDRGSAASTEDLRVVLQRYRSFFQRLLAA
jgi:hypothetical protein